MSANYWQGAEERTAELIAEFKQGRRIKLGPSVDDYVEALRPDPGQQITDEINADPEEVKRLTQARESARLGHRTALADAMAVLDDFFEEDEPVAEVVAAFEAAEQQLTVEPTGTGWCAPSP